MWTSGQTRDCFRFIQWRCPYLLCASKNRLSDVLLIFVQSFARLLHLRPIFFGVNIHQRAFQTQCSMSCTRRWGSVWAAPKVQPSWSLGACQMVRCKSLEIMGFRVQWCNCHQWHPWHFPPVSSKQGGQETNLRGREAAHLTWSTPAFL